MSGAFRDGGRDRTGRGGTAGRKGRVNGRGGACRM